MLGLTIPSNAFAAPFAFSFDAAAALKASGPSGKASFDCPNPVVPMSDMSGLFKFYGGDKQQSQVDRDAMARYVKRVKLSDQFKARLLELQGNLLGRKYDRTEVSGCIVMQLANWAKGNALTEGLEKNDLTGHRQAVLIQIWTGIAAANSYALAAGAAEIPSGDRRDILNWFAKLSESIKYEFRPREAPPPGQRWLAHASNQSYSAGVAVGQFGVLRNAQSDLDFAILQLRRAFAEADDEGGLRRELQRGSRALHYQTAAMTPIAMLVALADANQITFTQAEYAKIEEMAAFTLHAYRDPQWLAARVGKAQDMSGTGPVWIDVLLPAMRRHNPSLAAELNDTAAPLRPFASRFLGLQISQVFGTVGSP